ncbi:MAG: ABC transporter ATP-binding protein [Clostridia bacterium]|nr:ABC transporter ATP-binding protein [Clostridia bacterium]
MSGLSIHAEDLVKIYRARRVRSRALLGVSLDVDAGEFVSVVGTSGSGKSTLLNLLAGLEPPTSGRIYLGSEPVHRMSEDRLAAFRLRHAGFIFQNFNLFPDLTVLENAAFPLMLQGKPPAARNRAAAALLARLGLGAYLSHLPAELSGGQQQRVAIARALVGAPQIVFADEPTGNLDSATADSVMQILLSEVQERAMTLLMVTHDAGRAACADRIFTIRDGRIENIERGTKRTDEKKKDGLASFSADLPEHADAAAIGCRRSGS